MSWVRIPSLTPCVMSQDIEDTVNPRWVTVFSFWGGGVSGGLVVPGEVGVQFAQELAGGSVDDPGVQVVDQEQDVGPGVGPADADMAQAAAGAQGDGAVGVDGVAADAVVGVGGAVARPGGQTARRRRQARRTSCTR